MAQNLLPDWSRCFAGVIELLSVEEVKNSPSAKETKGTVSVHGYLVLRNGKVSMIQDDFDAGDWLAVSAWLDKEHVEILNEDLLYALLDQLPKRSGGVSPFFDKSVVTGSLSYAENGEASIRAEAIRVQPKYSERTFEIDLSEGALKRGMEVFEAYSVNRHAKLTHLGGL